MKKLKIAITGGIGSGKSTVCSLLKKKGYSVFSCDDIYGEIVVSDSYIQKIKALFPTAVENNQIDKKRLSDIVFSDTEKREQLNSVAHPLIMQELIKRMENAEEKISFAEVPLLFEGGFDALFDGILIVNRSEKERILAVYERDGLTEEEIRRRISVQFSCPLHSNNYQNFTRTPIFIINNNAGIEDLNRDLDGFIKTIL